MAKNHYIGIDIGGTKCAAVLGDEFGNILDKAVFLSGKEIDPYVILDEFSRNIKLLISNSNIDIKSIKAIGVSCGGPLDPLRERIINSPNLPLWDDVNIKEYFTNKFALPLSLQNDANACAVAEWRFGAGKGTQNMLFLTFGTGLGMGLILNGRLYTGKNDMAGEIGHIRLSDEGPLGHGKKGSFEGYCSGVGIKNLAQMMIKELWEQNISVGFCPDEKAFSEITAKSVCQAAEKSDKTAMMIIDKSAEYLGRGLSILIDILNPECIVIGSIFQRAEKLFRVKMEEIIRQEALPINAEACKIVPSLLGDSIGDAAALSIAIDIEPINLENRG